MISKRERNAVKAKMDLLDAVGLALKKHGFAKLGVNTVAAEANMDKTAIYRYYQDFEELLKAYIEKQDYWLMSLKEFGNSEVKDKKSLAKVFIREQIETLISNDEFQQLILWELADKDGIATPITIKRELYSEGILKQGRTVLENCGINFNFILSIILGGIYYVVIHKEKAAFCEVDLTQKKHKDELIRTLEWLIDLLFATNERVSELENVAKRAYEKGMSIEDVSEITGLDIEKMRELLY